MPEVCGAKNRRGTPCQRAPAKGKKRCRLHGGASTGPKTPEGKAVVAMNGLDHGAYQSLATYERLLAGARDDLVAQGARPDLFLASPKDTTLERELRFARMKLARLAEHDPKGLRTTAAKELLSEIRLLALAQHELRPGGDATGAFEVTLRVHGAAPTAPPESEAGEPCPS